MHSHTTKAATTTWPQNITVHRQKPAAVTTVYSVPDDGRKGCQWKHVEFLTPNKEHEKVASCWHLYDQCTVTFNKIL